MQCFFKFLHRSLWLIRSVDWNDVSVTTVLFQLFLGNRNSKENIKPEHRRFPACTRLRLKLFTYLIRSREATTQFPACIQLTFEGLFGESSNAKLRGMALQFLHQMINKYALLFRTFTFRIQFNLSS